MNNEQPFLTDVTELRARARKSIEKGAVTPAYHGDVKQTIDILQAVLATEIVCVLRYKQNYYAATGLNAEPVAAAFLQHAAEEQQHADLIAARINQLGGAPDFNPDTLTARSHAEYTTSTELADLITENLVAERIAIESYTEIIGWLGNADPTSRRMFEQILATEEEHAVDLLDFLEKLT